MAKVNINWQTGSFSPCFRGDGTWPMSVWEDWLCVATTEFTRIHAVKWIVLINWPNYTPETVFVCVSNAWAREHVCNWYHTEWKSGKSGNLMCLHNYGPLAWQFVTLREGVRVGAKSSYHICDSYHLINLALTFDNPYTYNNVATAYYRSTHAGVGNIFTFNQQWFAMV